MALERGPRVREEIAGVLGEPLLDRLLSGSRTHAARRIDEMQAAAASAAELGIEPRVQVRNNGARPARCGSGPDVAYVTYGT